MGSQNSEISETSDLTATPLPKVSAEGSADADLPAVADSSVAAPVSKTAPVNKKRLEQVAVDWPTEASGQLSVAAGEFLWTWVDTKTEIGWIYAERLLDQQQPQSEKNSAPSGGWIAVRALEP